ncbi:hypothetical protein HAX54_022137 [Datura stramonium]|uniref:Uncharacterized protein n=1 Tax=Datura stramonium TaxID=4076 RepID=A0ABS8UW49_DATST|nr:hypothetical protein [Datura stramonium]
MVGASTCLAVEVEKHNKRGAYLLRSPSLSKSKKKKLNHRNCNGPILPSDGEESKSSSRGPRRLMTQAQRTRGRRCERKYFGESASLWMSTASDFLDSSPGFSSIYGEGTKIKLPGVFHCLSRVKKNPDFIRMVKLESWAKSKSVLGISYDLFRILTVEDGEGYAKEIVRNTFNITRLLVLEEGFVMRKWACLSSSIDKNGRALEELRDIISLLFINVVKRKEGKLRA